MRSTSWLKPGQQYVYGEPEETCLAADRLSVFGCKIYRGDPMASSCSMVQAEGFLDTKGFSLLVLSLVTLIEISRNDVAVDAFSWCCRDDRLLITFVMCLDIMQWCTSFSADQTLSFSESFWVAAGVCCWICRSVLHLVTPMHSCSILARQELPAFKISACTLSASSELCLALSFASVTLHWAYLLRTLMDRECRNNKKLDILDH